MVDIISIAFQLIIDFTLVEKMLSTNKKLVVSLRPIISSPHALTTPSIKSPFSNWFMTEDIQTYDEHGHEVQYELLE